MWIENDVLAQSKAIEAKTHKTKQLFPTTRAQYLLVKCNCSENNFIYSHSQTIVHCKNPKCKQVLGMPTGKRTALAAGLTPCKSVNAYLKTLEPQNK